MGKVGRRPQAAKFPLRKEPSSGPMRASGPTKKRSIIAPSSVTASPCHLSLSPLSLRDIIPTPFGLRPFPPDRGNRPLDKGSRPPGGRHDGRVRTPAPTGIVGKNSGRTMCAPTGEVAGTWPLIRPSVRTGAPSPQGEGLRTAPCGRPYGGGNLQGGRLIAAPAADTEAIP